MKETTLVAYIFCFSTIFFRQNGDPDLRDGSIKRGSHEQGLGTDDSVETGLKPKEKGYNRENEILGDNDKIIKKMKANVTLTLDDYLVHEMRKEAAELNQSLNVRISSILQKHVKFYRMTESNGAAVIHPLLAQFLIQEANEARFIEHWKNLGIKFVEGYFRQNRIAFTFENFVKYYLEELAIYAGIIKGVSKHVDEQDGKMCLFLIHSYDSKWSRIIGATYSFQIEQFLKVHTTLKIFPDSVEIKILEKIPSGM